MDQQTLSYLVGAAKTTLALFLAVTASSTALGIGLAIALDGPAQSPARVYSWLLRGIPPIIILFIVFFGLPQFGIAVPSFLAAWLGMSAYGAAYMGEIIRSGLKAVPLGVREAARALGIPYHRALARIYLPQARSVILPPFINELTELLKDTAVASVVGVIELANAARTVTARTFNPLPVFATAALIYALLTIGLLVVQEWAGRRLWRAGV
jgi:His/Glu/Gln/Arg/opine family amino acid ABC transporter permease subunit